ncbi:protein lin-12-like isoform X2 [Amphiura filiformis]|uniref:protein lin-12-like isoform X2 n=1 Tax=Amphiura filiformis TaxID=82378 RepID=UPI003B219868
MMWQMKIRFLLFIAYVLLVLVTTSNGCASGSNRDPSAIECPDHSTEHECLENNNSDECLSNPCVHGLCKDGDEAFSCECFSGYFGNRCQYKRHEIRT